MFVKRSQVFKRATRCFSNKSIYTPTSLTAAVKTRSVAEDTFEGFVTDRWSIGDAPNGGFLMMMALDAASQCTTHPDPLSCSTTFLNKADENEPVLLQVRRMMMSKSMSILHVTMRQKQVVRSEHTAIFGTLSDSNNPNIRSDGFDHSVKLPVELPPRQDCIYASPGWRKQFGKSLNIVSQTEAYVSPASPAAKGMLRGKTTDHASVTTYLGLSNREIPSLSSMAFFNDAMFPPVLNLTSLGWVPTLQYSVHFWNRPPVPAALETQKENPPSVTKDLEPVVYDECFVRAKFETDYVRNSWLYTDGEIWSHDGSTLLATSRQLARLLSPKASANSLTKDS